MQWGVSILASAGNKRANGSSQERQPSQERQAEHGYLCNGGLQGCQWMVLVRLTLTWACWQVDHQACLRAGSLALWCWLRIWSIG
jgi:hypothetical protein